MENTISIDGLISSYGYSNRYLKYMLAECKGPVSITVSSYGGDVNEALKMCHSISEHGNITVDYIALNASASTLLGLHAKKSRIASDSLFLIHKPLVPVDQWGYMNEDKLEEVIKELQAQKKDAEVFTLTLAQKYVEKSGKSLSDILSLMKEERWLTANEAVNMGFVDEVFSTNGKSKPVITYEIKGILNSIEIPIPVLDDNTDNVNIISKIQNFFNKPQKKQTVMNKSFSFLNQVAGVEGFEVSNDVVALSVATLTSFDATIKNLTDEKNTLTVKVNNATSQAESLLASLDALDDSVKNAKTPEEKITAIKTLLNSKPGIAPSSQAAPDLHHSVNDTELDPVNDYFNE